MRHKVNHHLLLIEQTTKLLRVYEKTTDDYIIDQRYAGRLCRYDELLYSDYRAQNSKEYLPEFKTGLILNGHCVKRLDLRVRVDWAF